MSITSPGPMLRTCSAPECGSLTLGTFCAAHDAPVLRTFVRGRPYAGPATVSTLSEALALGATLSVGRGRR